MLHDLLQKYLQKLGITEYSQLTAEEKDTYRKWETALVGRKLTDDEVSEFLASELDDAIIKVTSKKLGEREDIFLKMEIEFIRKLRGFLNVPALEKAMVGREIENLLQK